jgi:hypothetical protein
VRDVASDHAAEGVAQHGERLVAESGDYLLRNRVRDILCTGDAFCGRPGRAGEIEVDTPPSTRALEGRLEGQQAPVIEAEPVVLLHGDAGTRLMCKHGAETIGRC